MSNTLTRIVHNSCFIVLEKRKTKHENTNYHTNDVLSLDVTDFNVHHSNVTLETNRPIDVDDDDNVLTVARSEKI